MAPTGGRAFWVALAYCLAAYCFCTEVEPYENLIVSRGTPTPVTRPSSAQAPAARPGPRETVAPASTH